MKFFSAAKNIGLSPYYGICMLFRFSRFLTDNGKTLCILALAAQSGSRFASAAPICEAPKGSYLDSCKVVSTTPATLYDYKLEATPICKIDLSCQKVNGESLLSSIYVREHINDGNGEWSGLSGYNPHFGGTFWNGNLQNNNGKIIVDTAKSTAYQKEIRSWDNDVY